MPWGRLENFQKQATNTGQPHGRKNKEQAHFLAQRAGMCVVDVVVVALVDIVVGAARMRRALVRACVRLSARPKPSARRRRRRRTIGGVVRWGSGSMVQRGTGKPQAAQPLEPHSIGGGWGGWACRSRLVANAPRTRRSQAPLPNKNGPAPFRET